MLVGVVAAKGAPGATVAALALAACEPGGAGLLVELDPSGGSIECWTESPAEPGLIRVVNGLRRPTITEVLGSWAFESPPGVASVLAPTAGLLAESTIAAAGDRLLPALAAFGPDVVVDGGRWAPSQPTARRMRGCDVMVVVCPPTLPGVEATRWLVEPLTSSTGVPVVVAVVGERPYPVDEVAAAVGAPVAGTLAWDRHGLAALLRAGAGRAWARSALARSARSLLAALRTHAAEPGVRAGA